MDVAASSWFLPAAGLLAGALMGFVARRSHFCTLSALERHWYAGDNTRLRAWVLAGAVALALTQAFNFTGHIDLGASFYLSSDLAYIGAILGGIAFGFGMALVGTCGFGALLLAGGGSLRSLVVLIVLGLSALSAQRGIAAWARVRVSDNLALDLSFAGDQSLGSVLSALAGLDLRLPAAILVAVPLFWWVLRDRQFRRNAGQLAAGLTIGCVIAFGWVVTTLAYRRSFDPVQIEAGSFVVPVADTILAVTTYTGVLPDYGVGLVLGVVVGAAAAAFGSRDMRWEACDDARELGRHILGAVLMGVGGVFAMGCTIGQGVTAVSALALSAPLVIVSIAIGARLGLAHLIEGSAVAPFRATAADWIKLLPHAWGTNR